MKIVRAMFPGGQKYDYYVPIGDDPRVGDLILTSVNMPTLRATDSDFTDEVLACVTAKVATIVEVGVPEGKSTKIYLQLIAAEDVRRRYEENKAEVERIGKMREARKALDRMLQESSREEQYEKLAEKSPEARRLLDVLRGGPAALPKE